MSPDELKAYRHARALSQAELARLLGVARTTIIELEHGRQSPSRQFLLALAAHAAGLEPYQGDPRDVAAFNERRPRRVQRAPHLAGVPGSHGP